MKTRGQTPAAPRRSRPRLRRVLGLMAGTSADGIDAVCAEIRGHGESMRVRLLWHRHQAFARRLRQRLLAVMAPAGTTTQELACLHAELGEAFADAACRAIRAARRDERPDLVGLAGQTVCHLPGSRAGRTVTLQIGEPARVAARTGLDTVAEFRQSDVAAGGQGAPLVPWTDWLLLRDRHAARAVQNIGGIANVTWLPAGAQVRDVTAFDTGPGNMIIDALVAHATDGRERMDRHGRRAARGRVLPHVLAAWLRHPFFSRRPPRTTGRETFGKPFIESQLPRLRQASGSPDDWIATATAFTARSIARALRRWLPLPPSCRSGLHPCRSGIQPCRSGIQPRPTAEPPPRRSGLQPRRIAEPPSRRSGIQPRPGRQPGSRARGLPPRPGRQPGSCARGLPPRPEADPKPDLIVCGGGCLNPTLMAMLAGELPCFHIRPIASLGIAAQAKEALSFAILAAACADGTPSNVPQATGASRPVCLGRIVHP